MELTGNTLIDLVIILFGSGGIGLIFLNRLTRMMEKRLEDHSKAQSVELQLALRAKEADIAADQAQQNTLNSLISLVQTQLQTIPEMTSSISELVQEIRAERLILTNNIENILSSTRQHTETVTSNFQRKLDMIEINSRSQADGNLLMADTLTQSTNHIRDTYEQIAQVVGVAYQQQSKIDERMAMFEEKLLDVVEMMVFMRNTIVRLTTSDPRLLNSLLIRSADDSQPVYAPLFNTDLESLLVHDPPASVPVVEVIAQESGAA